MKLFTLLLSVVAVVVLAAVAVAETEIETAPLTWKQAALDDGGALYAELCAVCHGVDGKGNGPAAPALEVALSDLTMLAADNDGVFPADRIRKVIEGGERVTAHGTVDMPVWGKAFKELRPDHTAVKRWAFSRSRVYNLTEYLKAIQAK